MCWSARVSLITFVVALIGIIYLYRRNKPNDRWIAIFMLVVSLIQLAEYFMWKHPKCNQVNKLASMFALFILALEPAANMVGGLAMGKVANKAFLRVLILTYIIFIAYLYGQYVYGSNIKWCGLPVTSCVKAVPGISASSCHLHWNFLDGMPEVSGMIWICFLMLPLLTMLPRSQGLILFLSGTLTYVISRYHDSQVTSSMWCWYSIVIIYLKILM